MKLLAIGTSMEFNRYLRRQLRRFCENPTLVEAPNLERALDCMHARIGFSLAILSLEMSGQRGGPALEQLRKGYPDLPLLFMAGVGAHMGALGDKVRGRLPRASKVGQGAWLGELIAGVFGERSAKQTSVVSDDLANDVTDCRLTPRQLDVLSLIKLGKSNKEIARILELAEGTVKIHCMAIFRELGVTNRTQAAMRAEHFLPPVGIAIDERYAVPA